MSRLEEIVRHLERGDVPLEASISLFEEGTALMKQCNLLLSKAEQKVTKLLSGPDGTPVEQPMEEVADL